MLAYAFQVLHEDSYKKIASEKFPHTEDLLAAILAKGIASQVKKGIEREYISATGSINAPQGKINISASLKSQSILKRQLVCDFDEFSENTYANQVIKAISMMLIRSFNVRAEQKKSLKKVMLYFHHVSAISPLKIEWPKIKYSSNNATYRMLIYICYLVAEGLLPTTQDGPNSMAQFRDEHLNRLFEKFVLGYYRKKYPDYSVYPAQINWVIDDGFTYLLPRMQTDITIETEGKSLIIDTKFYSSTLQTNRRYNSYSIHSNNLYQIYAYVKNKDSSRSGNTSGLLLYAKTDEDTTPDVSYLMDGNRISVRTLGLDNDFESIERQLNKIISEWIG